MNFFLELLIVAILALGAIMLLIGSIGLVRLPDFYTRLHAPTKSTTLGIGSIGLASMLYFSINHEGLSVHEPIITLFLVITAPISAYMLSKAALHHKIKTVSRTQNQHLAETARNQQPPTSSSEFSD